MPNVTATARTTAVQTPRNADPVAQLTALRQVLNKPSSWTMPPKAKEHDATTLIVKSAWASGDPYVVMGRQKDAVEEEWNDFFSVTRAEDPETFSETKGPFMFDKDTRFLNTYLSKSLTPAAYEQVKRILKDPAFEAADIGFVQSWDTSSDFIGYDRLIIGPKNSPKVLIIKLDYNAG